MTILKVWWRKARRGDQVSPWVADLALALGVMVLSLLPLMGVGGTNCDCPTVPAWSYFAAVGQSLPLIGRRLWPFVSSTTIAFFTIAYGLAELPDPPIPYAAVVGVYSVAAYAVPVLAYLTAAMAGIAVLLVPTFAAGSTDLLDYGNNGFVVAAAWVMGDRTRHRQAHLRAVEEQAAIRERTHIAREIHDVVAHAVTMMVVQAEAGAAIVAQDPEQASIVLDEISASGRHVQSDLRQLLGILRVPDDASDVPALGGPATPPDPQPTIAAIPGLVDRVRSAGLDVELRMDNPSLAVSNGTSLTAYRVVQEGLTNSARHGSSREASVEIRTDARELTITVVNSAAPDVATASESGHGIKGLRERVEAGGGTLSSGPGKAGEWRLEATIPLRNEARATTT